MTTDDRTNHSATHWLTDRFLRALIGGVLKLPYETRVRFMGRLMQSVIGPLSGYRARAEDNLGMIYPDMTAQEKRRIANACCDNFGRTVIENYSWRDLGARLADTTPTGPGLAAMQDAITQGRPVLFIGSHFGNHEAPRHALTAMGYEIGGYYRPMQNAYFNAHYENTLAAWSGPVFAQSGQGTIGFVRYLRKNGLGTLFHDVSAPGARIPFLGQPARTSLSAAKIGLKINAVMIPYFGIRQPDGFHFKIVLEEPIAHGDPKEVMIEINARLENRIAEHPEQWFWVHRRWKK